MTVAVTPDPGFAAGHAVVRVPGAAGAVGSPGFRMRREEDWEDDTLGPAGWQSSDALLMPDRAEASGGDLLLHVGWGVCRHLEAGMYTLEVPSSGQGGAAVFWPDIVPMHAGAVNVMTRRVTPEPTPGPVMPTPPVVRRVTVTASVAAPGVAAPGAVAAAAAPAVGPPRRLGGVLAAFLLALLAVGGVGYSVWTHRGGGAATEAQVPPAPPLMPRDAATPPAVQPAVALGQMSVPDVLAGAANPAAITAEGNRRLQGDRRDDGLLLLEAAADRGDGGASAALARLYDPVLFQAGGPIPKADPRQAARYYRDAARAGADVSAAREGLRHRLEAGAQSGDLGAKLSLGDFWP